MSTTSDPHTEQPPTPRAALLWRNRFRRLLVEMATGIERSALSLALSQRGELACALLDAEGRTVAEHGMALRAGALGPQVRAVCAAHPALLAGQIVAVSDPLVGGAELTTLTLLTLVVDRTGVPLGYLAVSGECGECAHPPAGPPESHVDLTAESLPLPPDENTAEGEQGLAALPPAVGPRYRAFQSPAARAAMGLPRTIDHEGESLPPTLLTDALINVLAHKRRDPVEALADLGALRGALRRGEQLLQALAQSPDALRQAMAQQLHDTQAAMRAALQRLGSGVYAFADSLDDDGAGASDVAVRATLRATGGRLIVDCRETADAVAGALNTVPAVAHAALRCALSELLPPAVAINDGVLAEVELLLRPHSLLDARSPHAVAAGATETAQRLIDVVRGALGQALPRLFGAASAGSASWVTLRSPRSDADTGLRRLYLREALAGGTGGRPGTAAANGRHTPTPGRRSTPVELIEQRLPVRVLRCALRADSRGSGVTPGGEGLVRELLLLADLHVELCGERRRRPPYGLGGGGPGQIGRDTLVRDGIVRPLPAKARLLLRAGDVLRTESPGGGGHGDPLRAAFYAALLG